MKRMKKKLRFYKYTTFVTTTIALVLTGVMLISGAFAEKNNGIINRAADYSIEDTNPAIYAAAKNANSVVGVTALQQTWNQRTRETTLQPVSQGSGVVIAEGGYILTNNHIIEDCDSFEVLLPSGDKVEATLTGADPSYDIAVLQVKERAEELVPVTVGSIQRLQVGSTVVAIGNPSGEELFNTVTSGIVSALMRNVDAGNTSRTVNYVQHSAAINSGNSGGGLFDINGNLVGINTLKYSGNLLYADIYEGLGFAIPVDLIIDAAADIIQYGFVQRASLGVMLVEVTGADEPTDTLTPAGLWVQTLVENGPAERAGIKVGDYLTAIDGERVTTMEQLTGILDTHQPGDTVAVTLARYSYQNTPSEDKLNKQPESFNNGFSRTSESEEYYGDFEDFFSNYPGGSGSFDDFFNNFFNDFFSDYYGDYPYTYREDQNKNSNSGNRIVCEVLEIPVVLEIVNQ